ncbi:MAG: helix-turn-helix domain-containing protein [Candidatus Methanoplasma sp.]|jgi:predicted transcriptional regulator|nr:helix-turn-helix domain-containing protein [Candidatus Methanoplasma sp.]
MNGIDMILSVVENPTRRRILMALVREPHYPLQLSKELGISQQAVVKNLDILERSGLVESQKESSDKGPYKTVYRPASEFTLTIDMRNGMFRTTLSEPEGHMAVQDIYDMGLEAVRENLSEIDRQINEFDKLREMMIERRNIVISSFMNSSVVSELDYFGRSMLYCMLNSPGLDVERVSQEMGVREDRMARVLDDIENKCRDARKEDEK